MLDWNTIKELWPIGLAFGGHVVRTEVGQIINKQNIKALEGKHDTAEKQREKDQTAVHSRIRRHEDQTSTTLGEIRNDIKELLRRGRD